MDLQWRVRFVQQVETKKIAEAPLGGLVVIQPNSLDDEFSYWDSQLESYSREELLWHLRSTQRKYGQLEKRFSTIEQNNERLKTVLNDLILEKQEQPRKYKKSLRERKKRLEVSEFLNFSIAISFRDILLIILVLLLLSQYFPNLSIKDWVELIASFTSKGGF